MAEQSEKNKKKSFFDFSFLKKFKSIKHLQVLIAIILGAVIVLIYFSTTTKSSASSENSSDEYTTFSAYATQVQQNLKQVLNNIQGAGNVDVMVTFDSGLELEIAYSTETKTTITTGTGGTKTETTVVVQTPILVSEKGVSKPIILKEKLPQPTSVIVVSSGASDTRVKLDLLKAVETILTLPSSKIEIFVGK